MTWSCGRGCWRLLPLCHWKKCGGSHSSRCEPGVGEGGRMVRSHRSWWTRLRAGGRIPLEALRLGCEAFASDLNPVACLILKVMLEDIPRHGPGLAEELRRVGGEIKRQAEQELAELYPRTRMGRRRLPICGRGRCAAKRQLRRGDSADCVRFGCARRPSASGRCGIELSAARGSRRASSLRCLSRRRIKRCAAHGGASESDLSVLWCGAAAGAGAGAACG